MTPAFAAEGMASYYGRQHHGLRTASGERFNMNAMTCAMRVRRFGHSVTVTALSTGRSATCRVNDFGPASRTGRIIDVSAAMAGALGFKHRGTARVEVR